MDTALAGMHMIDKNAVYFLESLPFFSGLPAPDIAVLAQASLVRDFDKGQNVFLRGDDAAMVTALAVTTVVLSVILHGATAQPLMLWRRQRLRARGH